MGWGLLGALAAAVSFGLASVMQALAVQAAGDRGGLGPRLLIRLLGQWRFGLSLVLDLLGYLGTLAALRTLPVFVVQAAVAASLAVVAVVASGTMAIRLGWREWAAVVTVCAGLALLGSAAAEEGPGRAGTGFRLALLISVGVLVVLGVTAARLPAPLGGSGLGLVAGLGFGVVSLASRAVTSFAPGQLLRDPAGYAIALAGTLSFLLYAAAFQRGGVTQATAAMVVGETVLPAVIGVAAFGDRTRPGFAGLAVLGFGLAVAGALLLARFGEIGSRGGPVQTVLGGARRQ
jgi:drug/metabolite transporter (DMT)-like permease